MTSCHDNGETNGNDPDKYFDDVILNVYPLEMKVNINIKFN